MAMDEPANHDQSNGYAVFLSVSMHRASDFRGQLSGGLTRRIRVSTTKKLTLNITKRFNAGEFGEWYLFLDKGVVCQRFVCGRIYGINSSAHKALTHHSLWCHGLRRCATHPLPTAKQDAPALAKRAGA